MKQIRHQFDIILKMHLFRRYFIRKKYLVKIKVVVLLPSNLNEILMQSHEPIIWSDMECVCCSWHSFNCALQESVVWKLTAYKSLCLLLPRIVN